MPKFEFKVVRRTATIIVVSVSTPELGLICETCASIKNGVPQLSKHKTPMALQFNEFLRSL